jgi:uncharacterized protein (DUF4415 family)
MAMPRKRAAGRKPWTDPDDAPELTAEFFARADVYDGARLIRRGRPPAAAPKRLVTLRLDRDVLAGLRATGPGWQTRANAALKAWLARQRHRAAE